jgi:ATP-dependent helicase/nuclease subunit A
MGVGVQAGGSPGAGPPMEFTAEQLAAIERRSGRLVLDAGAGSGKTSVLVERYARAVEQDGVDPAQILAITFTEKAAAEMRRRVRRRLELNEDPGWILTIHGFCARVLSANALSVGLDPQFRVLEEDVTRELSSQAFDAALAVVAETPSGAELVAAHRVGELRAAVMASYRELRSRGERQPRLPVVPSPAGSVGLGGSAPITPTRVAEMAAEVMVELGAVDDPGITVTRALDSLAAVDFETDWPGDLPELGNRAGALRTETCERYRAALAELRDQLAARIALRMRDALDALLVGYGQRYEAAKRARGGVDFDDLELLARDVLAGGARYGFAHVMVDELQDTNAVQLELVDLVAGDAAVFMVGDAQQSIYGFRHADVSLFRARGRELEAAGGRLALATNFRTRAEILEVLNAGFADRLEDFMALAPGRVDPPAGGPLVELLIADKTAEWERDEGLATPWRAAEARALAARVAELVLAGECRAADVVVLTRATTDLRVYERALEAAGVPTFVVGGRGYWNHPQVVDLVAYLRALANPRERESYWTVLVSPLCGVSLDGLVLVAAQAFDELDLEDAGRLARFETFFEAERRAALRVGPERLIDRALAWSGYDLELAGMVDGRRRLANVRKLMRLAREWEAGRGPDLAGFVEMLGRRGSGGGSGSGGGGGGGGGGGAREAEAPIESEALDAVALMTIHRSKGLEFPVVCVADLGRGPTWDGGLLALGSGGRLGLKISRPGVGVRIEALDYRELREERVARDRAEQRRLFYVAMTRAQERLILSGAARLDREPRPDSLTPIDWIAPAFRPLDGVAVRELREAELRPEVGHIDPQRAEVPRAAPPTELELAPRPAVESLSYSGLSLYERCGYRFYAERVLGLAPVATPSTGARARGVEIHAALAAGDFSGFGWNETFARVRAARDVRREQSFALALNGTLLTGVFDVVGAESDRLLVVDYKSDALRGRAPSAVVAEEYEVQRLIYGLAALRTGAARVEVVHLFLEDISEPAARVYETAQLAELEATVAARIAPLISARFAVTDEPHRAVCAGCPAAETLCPVPGELRTRTAAPPSERLYASASALPSPSPSPSPAPSPAPSPSPSPAPSPSRSPAPDR